MKLADLPAELLAARPHLFSAASVRISAADLAQMREIVAAVERIVALPAWAEKVGAGGTARAGSAANMGTAQAGVFMGYDFHLTPGGPRLIEINTNAGGALLAALQAQRQDVLGAFVEMFRAECPHPLKTLAIVDEQPSKQYLYPEFLGFQKLFAQHGIHAVICDPAELMLCHGGLWYEETKIDLVYNRLTDFTLSEPPQAALRAAWLQGGAVVTPNPVHHARHADKRNLVALTNDASLAAWGVDAQTRSVLQAGIPHTEIVTAERADEFWRRRRALFFKPAAGYGAKGAYRGEKLTRRVFDEILAGDYVAQAFVPPPVVRHEVNGEPVELKADIRNYAYRGKVQLVVARLYQGQTTNFRTPGGGFARVIEV